MGVSGSVAYMFDHVATFGIEGKSVDEILETLMEQDVDVNDVIDDNGLTIVYAEPINLQSFKMRFVQQVLKNLKLLNLKCYLKQILNFLKRTK